MAQQERFERATLWQFTASSGRQTLDADWTGGPGHTHLHGTFHGTLSQSGGVNLYRGPFHITEDTVVVDGTMTITIDNANQVEIDLQSGSSAPQHYTFSRTGGSSPSITPSSVAPQYGVTTDYQAPDPGAVASYPTPALPAGCAARTRATAACGLTSEGIKLWFVDPAGNYVQVEDEAALEAQAENANKICTVLMFTAGTPEQDARNESALGFQLPPAATCTYVVAQILARNEQLQKAKAARARTAGAGCASRVHKSRRAKAAVVVTCKSTGTGLQIVIRSKNRKLSLAKALHGHAPKLYVARSSVTPGPSGLRLQMVASKGG